MKIIASDILKEKVVEGHRLKLRSIGADESINSGIISGQYEINFTNRITNIDSISDSIEITIEAPTQAEFEALAASIDERQFSFNNTDYIRPVNRDKLLIYESRGKITSYSVVSNVNYYDKEIDDFMSFVGSNANIYKDSF